jgi:hypothetical protein
MQVYPVMTGVEVWVAASCMTRTEGHWDHQGDNVSFYVAEEELERRGVLGAVLHGLEMALSESPGVTERIRC